MIITKKVVFCEPDKCTGCKICEVVCSVVKEKNINPNLSRIHVVRIDPLAMMAITCQGCDEAPCVKTCPNKAISSSEEGNVMLDERKCSFCGWCIQSCPFGAIIFHPSRAFICDLCGGTPKCVEHCPKKALIFGTRKDIAQNIRRKNAENLLTELAK
jgi:Fe-S-cluster-containing hydrogenase component 2